MGKEQSHTSSRLIGKLPMDMAAARLLQIGVQSSYDFKRLNLGKGDFSKSHRPLDVPGDPVGFYEDFTNWDDFLSRGQAFLDEGGVVPSIPTYEEFKQYIREHKIDTKQKFNKFVRENSERPNLPKAPDRFYKQWEGWDFFLAPNAKYWPYETAKRFVHKFRLKSSVQWKEFCRNGKRPPEIPALPHRDYKEFVSWADFLGYEEQAKRFILT